MSYEDRLNEAKFRLQRNVHLPKGQSKAILINDCPYCQEYRNCSRIIKDDGDHIRMLCKIRSNELDAVWLNIRADDRPVVRPGDRFGKLSVISQDRPDESGKLRWLCVCDCGKHKVVRGDNLLSENTASCGCDKGKRNDLLKTTSRRKVTVSNEEKRVTFPGESVFAQEIESRIDAPGLVKHREVSTYVNKTGQSVDHFLAGIDEDRERHECYLRGRCPECHARTEYNKDGYQQCTNCGVCNSEPSFDGVQEYTISQIKAMDALFKGLKPQDSFGQPPDCDLKKRILLDEIALSDHIDNSQGEFYSVPFRSDEDWAFVAANGCAPGADVENFPHQVNKADWWDRKRYPATEVITSDLAGQEYTLFGGQQIAYVDNFLEKVLANLRPHR